MNRFQSFNAKRRGSAAFSLMELLVVIVIISVLMALLLPLLGRMRESAKAASCAAQLRQIYVGLVAYSQEYRGYLPRAATSSTLDMPEIQDWYGTWLRPTGNVLRAFPVYVGGTEALDVLAVCPSNRYPVVPYKGGTYTPKGIPYVCNYEAMTQNGVSNRPANLWQVVTDKLILIMDADPENWKGPGFTKTSGWERIGERHLKNVNTLWADGRVAPMRKADLRKESLVPQVR